MAFGKDDSSKRSSDEIIIYMGKSVEIKGNVSFEGSGRIDGRVEGKITVKGSLILGEGAMISSEIEGDTVVVGGKVNGKITAHQKVQLLKTSIFTGDVITPSLIIEEGAQFNGSCRMANSAAVFTPSFKPVEIEEKRVPVMAVK